MLLLGGYSGWVMEYCFAEGKGELGMDHYELRSWPG